jgi:drug/metabolite transporter (DMT)-like permease
MSQPSPGSATARPRPVTIAGVIAASTCVLLVLLLFETQDQLRSVEVRRSVIETLRDADLAIVSVDQVLAVMHAIVLVSAALAAAGLVLVLDLLSGADLAWSGVAWALAAMVGATAYFIISARPDSGLPPMALAGTGLFVAAVTLTLLGVTGVLPMRTSAHDVGYATGAAAWWQPLILLGLVTAALAYTTGIVASRRLGSRVASFVALLEVVAAVGFAWLLLAQLPGPAQLAGGLLIVAGVVVVKIAERPA